VNFRTISSLNKDIKMFLVFGVDSNCIFFYLGLREI
jgi:hypothetical protein